MNGAKVALAVGAGYLLGRTRKMRLALMLAAAGITGKFPAKPTDLVAYGLKSLGASADLSDLTQQLRGEVLDAARAAALAAATHQVDAINNRLQGVVSTAGVDDLVEDVGDTVDKTTEPVRSVAGLGRRRSSEEEEDLYDEDEDYEDEEPLDVDEDIEEDEESESPRGDEADLDEDESEGGFDEEDMDETEPEDEEQEPARPRRRATRQATAPKTSGRRSSSGDGSTAVASRRRAAVTGTKRAPVRRGR